MDASLRLDHRIEIGLGNGPVAKHYFTPPRASRSAVVNATLSRT